MAKMRFILACFAATGLLSAGVVTGGLKKIGQGAEAAGKETGKLAGRGVKATGKGLAKGSKKGVHQMAKGTRKGASKVEDKTN